MPLRRALPGAWRRLPRVTLAGAHVLGRWDDPPDFDGDGLPDPIVALEYVHARTPCRAIASDHPCPTASHDDAGGDGANGPLVVAFTGVFSGDVDPRADAGAPTDVSTRTEARLLGTRRIWLSAMSTPRVRVSTFEFGEFGPGLLVRTILDADEGPTVHDVIDVIDIFTGVGLDRRAGALLHHCTRQGTLAPVRTGSFSVDDPALTPLVWRAITAHPYSGCATEVATLDTAFGTLFAGALQVNVVSTTPAGAQHRIAIAVDGPAPRTVPRTGRDAATWADPLTLGPVRVTTMERGCQFDRLRFDRDGHHCVAILPRSDDPLPGCETHTSPLDTSPPRPLWLHPHAGMLDGGVPTEPVHLVFARGGTLWETTLPLACGRAEHRTPALPWRRATPAPAGVAVSPSGERVLFGHGDDLWLFTSVRRAPYLLNPPGGALPRHDVRATSFVTNDRAAVIFSGQLIVFDLTVPTADIALPDGLRFDASEVRRGLRATVSGR